MSYLDDLLKQGWASPPGHIIAWGSVTDPMVTKITRGGDVTNLTNVAQTWGNFIPIHWGNIRIGGYQIWSSNFYNIIIDQSISSHDPARYYSDANSSNYTGPATYSIGRSMILTAIDVAYSFGINGNKNDNKIISKIYFDGVEVYNYKTPDTSDYETEIHYGDVREKSDIINSQLKEKTTYFPDQTYIVFKQLMKAQGVLPNQISVEFNIATQNNDLLEFDPTEIQIEDDSAVFMPNFDKNILYVYRDEIPYGKIEKYDLLTSNLLATKQILISGAEGALHGNVLITDVWFPKANLIAYQVIHREGAAYNTIYKYMTLWVINPDTGQVVGSYGSDILHADDDGPLDLAKGLPSCDGCFMVKDSSNSAQLCYYHTSRRKMYLVTLTGSSNAGYVDIRITDSGQIPVEAAIEYPSGGQSGIAYYSQTDTTVSKVNIYRYKVSEEDHYYAGSYLVKSYAISEDFPYRLITFEDKCLLMSNSRAVLIDKDNANVYDKDLTATPLDEIGTITNKHMKLYPDGGTISWIKGVSYLFVFDIRRGTFSKFTINGAVVASAYDSYNMKTWIWNFGDYFVKSFKVNDPNVGNKIYLKDFIRTLYTITGKYEDSFFEFQDIDDMIFGALLTGPRKLSDIVNQICKLYRINKFETKDKIIFFRNRLADGSIDIAYTIDYDDLALPTEGGDAIDRLKITNTANEQTPSAVTVNFIDIDSDYAANSVTWTMPGSSSDDGKSLSISVPIVMSKNDALTLGENISIDIAGSTTEYEFRLSQRYLDVSKGDIIVINDEFFQNIIKITDTDINGDFSVSFKGEGVIVQEISTFEVPDIPTNSTTGGLGSGPTYVQIFDTPAIINEHNPDDVNNFVQYSLLYGDKNKWQMGYLSRKVDNEFKYMYTLAGTMPSAVFSCSNALNYKRWVIDTDELRVINIWGSWPNNYNQTETEMFTNKSNNIAFYGKIGRWEIVRFCSIENGVVKGILRGTRGTEIFAEGHEIGDYFIPLVDFIHSEIREADLLGNQEEYRAVNIVQTVDSAVSVNTVVAANSLKPWSPVNVHCIRNEDGDIEMNWSRRDRKAPPWEGGSLINSEETEAYEIDIYVNNLVVRTIDGLTVPTCVYSRADQISDGLLGTEIVLNARIYQISAVVGRGFPYKDLINVQ